MATILFQLAGLVFAGMFAWIGIQGLRGVPDAGKRTSKATAVVALILGAGLAVATILAPILMWG